MRRWLVTLLGMMLMAGSIYGYGRYAEGLERAATMAETLMPARLIASGEMIDDSMLRRVEIPMEALEADALADVSDVVGKTALMPIGPNEQIAGWKLSNRQLTPEMDERYISFPTDDVTNIGNMLRRGDRVDVWVEFENPVRSGDGMTGTLKVIEGLRVASVRTAEGTEVADGIAYDGPFPSASRQLERTRSSANGKPAINTYLMTEEIYEAYSLAMLSGRIKLALPDLSLNAGDPAKVTEAFGRLGFFHSSMSGNEKGE